MRPARFMPFATATLTLALCFTLHAQSPGKSSSKPESVEARLQRLEDIEEIRNVLVNYGRYLDARDLAAYSSLFSKDGEWTGGFGSAKGPAGILAFMEKNIGTAPNTKRTFHQLSNFQIEVKGDTATAWSRWIYYTPNADHRPIPSESGRYEDLLIRENGKWKFRQRVVSNDIPQIGEVPPPTAPSR